MFDGLYKSVICFFMAYLLYEPATALTENGRGVEDFRRMGVYVACATIFVINTYILLNTYRWDWVMLLVVAISTLLIWTWTGIYTSFTASDMFYKAAAEVYGTLTFWSLTLLTIIICLLPRFSAKFLQKNYFPLDVDIIREQVRQGKFDHLDKFEAYVPPSAQVQNPGNGTALGKPGQTSAPGVDDDERPIYPPSVAPTGTTHNPRSQNGSDGTDYSRRSLEMPPPHQPSADRPRPSFERPRPSVDRIRPSYEASNDFTSAALLTRVESSHSGIQSPTSPTQSRRRHDISSELW